MANLIRKAKRVGRSITGFSIPIFGLQWTPPKDEREDIRALLTFLEDRRALYNPTSWEEPDRVYRSVQEIRGHLTDFIPKLAETSNANGHVLSMRRACRKYVDSMDRLGGATRSMHWHDREFLQALGEWRAVMGLHIAALSEIYGVVVQPELLSIFPGREGDFG
jgi:hypothetical protein